MMRGQNIPIPPEGNPLSSSAVYLFIVIISKHNLRGLYCPGVFSNGETPVPIPNTAVKPVSADGSETSVS